MDIYVQLPLHVKNWVCHYTRKNVETDFVKLPLRYDHPFSSYVVSLLEKKNNPDLVKKPFNLLLSLPDHHRKPNGHPDARYNFYTIPEHKAKDLIVFFESLMRKELFDRLDVCEKYGLRFKDEINFFIEKYQCENSVLNYEALKKAYYRHRQKNKTTGHPLSQFF